jgi:hypothetical protein
MFAHRGIGRGRLDAGRRHRGDPPAERAHFDPRLVELFLGLMADGGTAVAGERAAVPAV